MTLANPPVHHTNGDARFYYTPSVAGFGWTSALNTGYAAWDKTNGHQSDYVRVYGHALGLWGECSH